MYWCWKERVMDRRVRNYSKTLPDREFSNRVLANVDHYSFEDMAGKDILSTKDENNYTKKSVTGAAR
jgi:hypothetical protein